MSEEIRCFGCGAIIQSEDENKIINAAKDPPKREAVSITAGL